MSKREQFRDREYRAAYADSHLDSLIATQIRVLRDQRSLSQQQLADLTGMRQSRISTMEDVNYSRWSVSTLKRLARAFDLVLTVRFETFGSLLGEAARLTASNLRRESFEDDPLFRVTAVETQLTPSNDARSDLRLGNKPSTSASVVVDATSAFGRYSGPLRVA